MCYFLHRTRGTNSCREVLLSPNLAEGETFGPQSGYNGALCEGHVNHAEGYCFFSEIIQLGGRLPSDNEGVRVDRLPMLLPSDIPSYDRKDPFP